MTLGAANLNGVDDNPTVSLYLNDTVTFRLSPEVDSFTIVSTTVDGVAVHNANEYGDLQFHAAALGSHKYVCGQVLTIEKINLNSAYRTHRMNQEKSGFLIYSVFYIKVVLKMTFLELYCYF